MSMFELPRRHPAETTARPAIVAHHSYRLAAVTCDTPLLVVPLSGHKRLQVDGDSHHGDVDQFVMIHKPTAMDVENIPDHDRPYRALCVDFPWHVVELARRLLRQTTPPQTATASTGATPLIATALGAWVKAEDDPAVLDYQRLGLLLALARSGHDAFLGATDPSLASRVRLMVAASPARDWTSALIEEALHISGATLRRRLAEDGTSLRVAIREARMHAALSLLQTSPAPLKRIAATVGYRSVPSFRRQFLDRFGIEPAIVAARVTLD